jgi:predicted sulfurtransferase
MNSIILFYKYIYIDTPSKIMIWQKELCSRLGLKGRVIIGHEGINATLGGNIQRIAEYKQEMLTHELFGGIDFKETFDTADHFPRLRVVVKKEIVNLGLDPEIITADQAGKHLDPLQAHELMAKKPDDLVIIDCRNKVESAIGTIQDAIRPDVTYFREFPAYVDQHLDDLKDKQVLMYCTAGIRCERASAYIKSKGVAKEVYQIKGGIHRYIEQVPHGFFRGKNYVFDGRTAVKVTDDILGNCYLCQTPCDDYNNCLHAACNRHFIGCAECLKKYGNMCSVSCYELVTFHNAPKRPNPCKVYSSDEQTAAQ